MAVSLNKKALENAINLVKDDKVDKESDWELTPDEENMLLGDPPNWLGYAMWFLGEDTAENEETKGRYKYPFGKDGKVYRKGLTAIRQRAGQQKEEDLFNAAGELLDTIDSKNNEKNGIIDNEDENSMSAMADALDSIEHMLNMM